MSESLTRRLGYLGPRASAAARPVQPAPPGPDWTPIGRWTWRRVERVAAGWDPAFDLRRLGCSPEPGGLLFYDTETTGLSGGAGSLAFLAGLARPDGAQIELEQLFLADFPGEREFLEALAPRMFASPATLVSYNGKGFDSHLLRARFSLVGLEASFGEQMDLLYPVRRLWRRVLPECGLTAVAEAVLGVHRPRDLPGADVPEAYFEYLRHSDTTSLSLVFEHNRQDLLAMVGLLAHIEALLSGRIEPARVDATALGAWLLDRGEERGRDLLQRRLDAGDLSAGRLLGRHYKRRREWDRAVQVWERMAALRDAEAVVELAKHAEHRLRMPERALAWLDSAWPQVLDCRRDDARRRRTRLLAKVGRSG